MDSIEIPAEELAEDGLDQTIEKTVDIANYLPYWAKTDQDSAGGVPIVIKIQVEKFGTKTVEFPYNSIAAAECTKGLQGVIYRTGQSGNYCAWF